VIGYRNVFFYNHLKEKKVNLGRFFGVNKKAAEDRTAAASKHLKRIPKKKPVSGHRAAACRRFRKVLYEGIGHKPHDLSAGCEQFGAFLLDMALGGYLILEKRYACGVVMLAAHIVVDHFFGVGKRHIEHLDSEFGPFDRIKDFLTGILLLHGN
jgi:hypothetical protein